MESIMAFSASARWNGDKTGQGSYSLGSGAAKDVPYTFGGRFEDKGGSTPEELVGAAHAACFIMYLTAVLGETKHQGIDAEAKVSLGKDDKGPRITEIRLKVKAKIAGLDQATFDDLIKKTEVGCPISRLSSGNVTLLVDARLEA
jgi:lipoyl-dependent peroxiredoxin